MFCDICEYTESFLNQLKRHKQIKHDGVRFPRKFKATSNSDLNAHVRIVHNGQRFPCDQCDCQARSRLKLSDHVSRNMIK